MKIFQVYRNTYVLNKTRLKNHNTDRFSAKRVSVKHISVLKLSKRAYWNQ